MCVSPIQLLRHHLPEDYEPPGGWVLHENGLDKCVLMPCGTCWACRKAAIRDMTGRCLAEASTAKGVSVLTLTYGGNVPGSVVLMLSDVQKFIKRVRRRGYPMRYLLSGEHGSLFARAHWHMIIFWQSDRVPPGLPKPGSFGDWKPWGLGHVHNMPTGQGAFRYVCKYVLEDSQTLHRRASWSRKPVLGYKYFMNLADELVAHRIAPQSPFYTMPGSFNRNGKPIRYKLRDRTLEKFLDRWSIQWRLAHHEDPPLTDWVSSHYFDIIQRVQDRKEREDAAVARLEKFGAEARAAYERRNFHSDILGYAAHMDWVAEGRPGTFLAWARERAGDRWPVAVFP